MTRTRPRLWDGFDRGMNSVMRRMLDWDLEEEDSQPFTPDLNIVETDTGFEVSIDLPGVGPDQVKVEYKNKALWVSGERRGESESRGRTFHRMERKYGAFRRVIRLGTKIDEESINARFKEGVLTIVAAKCAAVQPRRVSIVA